MSDHAVPTALGSTLTMASLTLKRLLRGRAVYVALVIAFLPVAYVLVSGSVHNQPGEEVFVFEVLVSSVLAPMFVASSIGEEIEDRTTTYLWSRPIPRWSIVAGKLLALVPITIAIVLVSWALSSQIAWHTLPPLRPCAALALGVAVLSIVSSGIAALAPRHGMALTICYILFFDSPLGVLPATLAQLSVTHQIRALSGLFPTDAGTTTPLLALGILSLVYGTLAALRIRRIEA